MFPGADLHYADPAQPRKTPGEDLEYLDHDLAELCTIQTPVLAAHLRARISRDNLK